MFVIHQIVGVIADPIMLAIIEICVGVGLRYRCRGEECVERRCRCRKIGTWVIWAMLVFLWIYSMPVTSWWVTKWLESAYPVMRAEEMPEADAILVLGGGIGRPKEPCSYPYADLSEAADRVWHAARLWRAARAPKIYCTNREVSKSTPPFLKDLGIPEDAIVCFDGPRNTEEEAKRYEVEKVGGERKIRVLLVTSASHMKRAEMIFKKYAPSLEVIPAATDYHAIESEKKEFDIRKYLPSVGAAQQMSAVMHEILGLIRYTIAG